MDRPEEGYGDSFSLTRHPRKLLLIVDQLQRLSTNKRFRCFRNDVHIDRCLFRFFVVNGTFHNFYRLFMFFFKEYPGVRFLRLGVHSGSFLQSE